jgi:sugar lactone lactonase YvrE
MTFRFLPILALVSMTGALQAQQGTVNGPVSGYVFDKTTRALRPILGLPGASLVGSPVAFGLNATSAVISPGLDSAIVVATDGTVHLFRIQSGAVKELSVDGLSASAQPSFVVFSPSGSAAAWYAGGEVSVLTGLPDAPALGSSLSLHAVSQSAATAAAKGAVERSRTGSVSGVEGLAVSDDGKALLVAAANTVRLYNSGTDLGKLVDTSRTPVMAFAVGGHQAAIADPKTGTLLYQDLLSSGASQVVAPPDANNASPSAVAFAADGKTLFLASFAAQSVTQLDLVAGSTRSIACNCSPYALTRMGSVFRMNELGSDPMWLLDTTAANPRVVFVPALVQ